MGKDGGQEERRRIHEVNSIHIKHWVIFPCYKKSRTQICIFETPGNICSLLLRSLAGGVFGIPIILEIMHNHE